MQTKAGVPMAVHRLATTSAPAKITSKTKGKGKQVQRVSRHRRDIVSEFEAYFGSDNTKLENWQMVCRDVGIQGELKSITACRKVLFPVTSTKNHRHSSVCEATKLIKSPLNIVGIIQSLGEHLRPYRRTKNQGSC